MSGVWDDGGDWIDYGTGFSVLEEPLRDFFEQKIDYTVKDPIYDEPEVLLFVIGTEKKGYKDHHLLGTNAEYLGKYRSKDARWDIFKGYDGEPHVCRGMNFLIGELYQVPGKALIEVDKKYDQLCRTKYSILDENGDTKVAWLYHIDCPTVYSDGELERGKGIRVVNKNYLEFLA